MPGVGTPPEELPISDAQTTKRMERCDPLPLAGFTRDAVPSSRNLLRLRLFSFRVFSRRTSPPPVFAAALFNHPVLPRPALACYRGNRARVLQWHECLRTNPRGFSPIFEKREFFSKLSSLSLSLSLRGTYVLGLARVRVRVRVCASACMCECMHASVYVYMCARTRA